MNDAKIASKAKAQLAHFMGKVFTHFSKPALGTSVSEAVLRDGARSVRDDTLLLVDPTEIRKEFSYKMEFVTRVRDASRSSKEGRDVLVNGYHGCMVAACRPGGRKTVPLALKLWSSRSPCFKGENDEVLKIVKAVYAATGGKGTVVYDRGGERPTQSRTASGARSPASESGCARRRRQSRRNPKRRRRSCFRALRN